MMSKFEKKIRELDNHINACEACIEGWRAGSDVWEREDLVRYVSQVYGETRAIRDLAPARLRNDAVELARRAFSAMCSAEKMTREDAQVGAGS